MCCWIKGWLISRSGLWVLAGGWCLPGWSGDRRILHSGKFRPVGQGESLRRKDDVAGSSRGLHLIAKRSGRI